MEVEPWLTWAAIAPLSLRWPLEGPATLGLGLPEVSDSGLSLPIIYRVIKEAEKVVVSVSSQIPCGRGSGGFSTWVYNEPN